MERLEGRIAVVTGGASGIGRGMADAFAAEGMKLVLADCETAALDAAVAELREGGATVVGVECDVSRPDSVASLAERTLEEYGAAHVLCNNAGVAGGSPGALWEAPLDEWDWVMGVNLMGVVHGIRSFVPILLEQDEAHVVNTASMAGLMHGGGIYGVSKHGCVALSEALWSSLQSRGSGHVGVSVLCPGWVATRIAQAERNRPERPRPESTVPPEASAMIQVVEKLVASGMDPAEVGRVVADAVRERRFYVLPHPWEHLVEARMRNILDGGDPVNVPPPGIAEVIAEVSGGEA